MIQNRSRQILTVFLARNDCAPVLCESNPLVADGGNPAKLELASENISLSLYRHLKSAAFTSLVHIVLFSDIKFFTANNYLTVNCLLQKDTKHSMSLSFAFIFMLFILVTLI